MFNKFLLILLGMVGVIFTIQGAYSAPVFQSPVICSETTSTTAGSTKHHKFNCSVTVDPDSQNVKIGVFTTDYITTKTGGNGDDIPDFKSPAPVGAYRFKGISPSSSEVNVTTNNTGANAAIVKDNITTQGSANFDLIYTTYDADVGATDYRQSFTAGLFQDNGAAVDTANSYVDFDVQEVADISVSTNPLPALVLSSPSQVFTLNQMQYADTFTVFVKSNNTWKLQAKLTQAPTDGIKTININNNYFKCIGTTFDNLASTDPVQFQIADTYYDAAQNLVIDKTTGTSNGMDLDSRSVVFKLGLKNTSVFASGNYTTSAIFNLITPKP